MKKLVSVLLALSLASPVWANVEGDQVQYLGGTAANLRPGTIGRLDTSQGNNLVFEHADGKVSVPFAKITNWEITEKLARDYGVIATIVVVMAKYRQRRHYLRVSYRDDSGVEQAVVFEVSKTMPMPLQAVLEARAPKPKPLYRQYDQSCRCMRPTGWPTPQPNVSRPQRSLQTQQQREAIAALQTIPPVQVTPVPMRKQ